MHFELFNDTLFVWLQAHTILVNNFIIFLINPEIILYYSLPSNIDEYNVYLQRDSKPQPLSL